MVHPLRTVIPSVGRGDRGVDPPPALRALQSEVGRGAIDQIAVRVGCAAHAQIGTGPSSMTCAQVEAAPSG
jgi:hypothetical protein